MKKLCTLLVMIFIYSSIFGQTTNLTLNQPETGNKIKEATQSIKLLPGFSYKSGQGNSFIARIANMNEGNNNILGYNNANGESSTNQDADYYGSIQGSLDVNQLGGATYTIPIDVPPGTAGIQPQLSIAYNSQGGNGMLGMKWGVGGLSAISRINKNLYDDAVISNITFTDSDIFSLDGNRLVKLTDGSYMTKNETFAKITLEGTAPNQWFKVEHKNGQIFEYGNSSDSKMFVSGYNDNPLAWKLNKMTDANGNYIQFLYETINNESVIKKISYTGNSKTSMQPYNAIVFNYKKRKDINIQYVIKGEVYQSNILTSVRIECESSSIKEYVFEYDESILCSRLKKITEKITNTTISSSLMVNWGETKQERIATPLSSLSQSSQLQTFTGNFTGNGYSDILFLNSNSKWQMLQGKDNVLVDIPSLPSISLENAKLTQTADFDGDGKDDILLCTRKMIVSGLSFPSYKTYEFQMYLSTGNAFQSYQKFNFPGGTNEHIKRISPLLGDFTGKGRTQILFVINKFEETTTSGNNFNQFDLIEYNCNKISFKISYNYDKEVDVLDLDGDGIMEFLVSQKQPSSKMSVMSLKNNKLTQIGETTSIVSKTIQIGDIDGDRCDEIILIENDKASASIGKYKNGSLRFDKSISLTPYYSNANDSLFHTFYGDRGPYPSLAFLQMSLSQNKDILIKDFNGDGKADILEIFSFAYPEYTSTFYSFPEERRTSMILHLSGGGTKKWDFNEIGMIDVFADFNGDGNLDFLSKKLNGIYSFFNEKYDSEYFVKSITDDVNNESIDISYTRTSDALYHTKGTRSAFPNNDYVGCLPIVKSVQIPNGLNTKNKTEYKYSGLTVHRQGRGLLGFKEITTSDDAKSTQKIAYSETSSSVKFWYPRTITISVNGNIIQKTTNTMSYKSPLIGRSFGYNYISKEQVDDLLSGLYYTTSYVYDNYGNVTSKKIVCSDQVSTSDITQVEKEFTEQTIENTSRYVKISSWIPSYPDLLTQKMTRDGTTYSQTSSYTYDSYGNPLTIVNNSGTEKAFTTSYEYNSYGLPIKKSISAVNEETKTTTFGYDAKYRFITNTQNELGQSITRSFEPVYGNLLSETNSKTGLKTIWNYDNAGQLKEIVHPDGNSTKISVKKNSTVPLSKYYVLTEIPGKPYQRIYYDGLNRKIRTETQGFNAKIIQEKSYNAKGLVVSESDPYKENTSKSFCTYEYDDYGRIKKSQYKGLVSSYMYNLSTITLTNPAGQTTQKKSDAQGKVIHMIDADGNQVNYGYHPSGQLKRVRTGNKTLIEIEYDTYGHQTSMTDIDAGKIKYTYNAFGQLTRQEDALGKVFSLKYDKYGRITQKTAPNGNFTYVYCNANNASDGLIQSVTGPDNMKQQYEYDQWGNIITFTDVIQGELFRTQYGYDNYGNMNIMSYPSGFSIENRYNKAGYLYEVKNLETSKSIWKLEEADVFGDASKIMNGNGLRTEYTYNDYKTLTGIKTGSIQKLEYGLISSTRQLINSRADRICNQSETFQYNNTNQLTSSKVGTSSPVETRYASNGNIEYRSNIGNYSYRSDKIHAVETVSNDGGIIPAQQQEISYNSINKVSSVSEGIYRYTFLYGIDNERSKMLEYTNNSLSLEKIYTLNYEREKRGSSVKETHYIPTPTGTTAIYQKETGNTGNVYYLCKDHLGSITALVNESGTVVERYAYDPWGRRVNPNNWTDYNVTPSNRLSRGYTGHEHLDKVGLINMNGRMYDPLLGRMLSPDNIIPDPTSLIGYNRYAYCYNNPMSFSDPDGENPVTWIIGGAILLGKFYHDGRKANDGQSNPLKWDWGNANYTVGYSSAGSSIYGGVGWSDDYGIALGSTFLSSQNSLSIGYLNNGKLYAKNFRFTKFKSLPPRGTAPYAGYGNQKFIKQFVKENFGNLLNDLNVYGDGRFPNTSNSYYMDADDFATYSGRELHGVYSDGAIYLYKSAFINYEELYLTIGHEYIHYAINEKYPNEFNDNMTQHIITSEFEYYQSNAWDFYNTKDYEKKPGTYKHLWDSGLYPHYYEFIKIRRNRPYTKYWD